MSSSTTGGDFPSSKLEDLNITHDELNSIGEALKKEEFRKLLCDYVEEIQNPENRKLYEEELTELERQRGVDVTFVTPKACFVIKTSSNGSAKTFINICSNENIGLPTSTRQGNGLNWQVPYVLAPPRLDYDKKQEKCNVYDVVFHPNSIELGKKNKDFKQLLLDTALNGIEQSFKVTLDKVNLKYPNIPFKGSVHPTVLRRKADPSKKPKEPEEENEETLVQKSYNKKTEINGNSVGPSRENSHQNGNSKQNGNSLENSSISKINGHDVPLQENENGNAYQNENSQHNGSMSNKHQNNSMPNKHLNDSVLKEHTTSEDLTNGTHGNTEQSYDELNTPLNFPYPPLQENKPVRVTDLNALKNASKEGGVDDQYATPHYVIKEYNDVDLDNYTNDMYCKSNVTIPSKLIVEIKLPLLKTMEFTKLDICGRKFEFVSEKPSKYKLNLMLPYAVNDENGSAKFEIDRKRLVVILPVVYKSNTNQVVNNGCRTTDGSSNGITTALDNNKVNSGIPDNLPEKTCDSALKGTEKSAINETINQNICSKYTKTTESTNGITSLPNTNATTVKSSTPTRVQQSNIEVQTNGNTITTSNYLEIETENNSILNIASLPEKKNRDEIKANEDVMKTKPLVEVIETELLNERETKTIDQENILTVENGTKEATTIENGANENDQIEDSIQILNEQKKKTEDKTKSELPNEINERKDKPKDSTKNQHEEDPRKKKSEDRKNQPKDLSKNPPKSPRKNHPKDVRKNQSKEDVLKDFWNSKVFYQSIPEYQVNVNDNELVFIFNVINVEQDSVKHVLIEEGTVLGLQFVSIGAGFFRSYHGILLRFDHPVSFSSLFTLETNIILRLIHTGCLNTCYYVSNIQGGCADKERRVCIPMPEFYMENSEEFGGPQESPQQQTSTKPSQTEPGNEHMNQTTTTAAENELSIQDNDMSTASIKQAGNESNEKDNETKENTDEVINENLATSRKQKDESSKKSNLINKQKSKENTGINEKLADSKTENEVCKNEIFPASRKQKNESRKKGNVINREESKQNNDAVEKPDQKHDDEISEKRNDVRNDMECKENIAKNEEIKESIKQTEKSSEIEKNDMMNGEKFKEEEQRGEENIDCEDSKKELKEEDSSKKELKEEESSKKELQEEESSKKELQEEESSKKELQEEESSKKELKEEESDKENQDDKRGGGGRVESKGVNIPKSKSTSFLCENGQQYRVRGILKTCSRSLSISSDEEEDECQYSSSSCSVKKHVRFDEHISRKLFSSKYTILEQEKKYQKRLRHLSHKRERRVSETEASDSENHNRDRNNKFMSKKQVKRMNRNNKNSGTGTPGTNTNNGSKHGKNKLPGSGDCAAASWDSQHSEMSEDESKTSCSCSATSESGGNTSDSGDSGAASGEFEEMKLSMLAASRKEHKRRGKKNARKSASSAKTAAISGGGDFGNSYLFELDMN